MKWGYIIQQLTASHADAEFLIDACTGRTWTRGDFHNAAKSTAEELHRRGLERGDRLALLLPNGPEFILLYFGCLYAGVTVVPLNSLLHPNQIVQLIKIAQPKALIYSLKTEQALEATWSSVDLPMWPIDANVGENELSLWNLPRPIIDDEVAFAEIQNDQIFSINFTSGTTGQPKGVCHTVKGLFSAANTFALTLGMSSQTRMYHVLPMSYMAGFLNTILCPYVCGGSIVVDRAFDAILSLSFWRHPIKYAVNTFWLVPSILGSLLKIDRDKVGAVWSQERCPLICVGTAPLPLAIKNECEARYGFKVMESYGLSETLFIATNIPSSGSPGSVGRVLSSVEVRCSDNNGHPLPKGDTGELWVRTNFMMAGYWDAFALRPSRNEHIGDWFPTGDIGYECPSGEIFISGRKKDLIIRGGMNISPREVEDVLLDHPAVEEVAVIGMPDDFYGEQIIACIILKKTETPENLKLHCHRYLSSPSIPNHFLIMDCLPRGVTGKIQKNELCILASSILEPTSKLNNLYEPPSDPDRNRT